MKWINAKDSLPNIETPVIIVIGGNVCIGELRWDHPSYEDSYEAYMYWDDPNDDGKEWEWRDVTHWMPIPELPIEDNN